MNECYTPEFPGTVESKLAALIDAAGGDYPILSFYEDPEPRLHWSYSRLEIILKIDKAHKAIQFESDAILSVASVAAGLALVAATESIRQGHREPYIQYCV